MRVMKNKTLFESFQENLKEIDSNVKKLNEDTILWSSDLDDDYADWSEEDFINHYKEDTGEEPEDADQARDYYIADTDDAVYDIKKEDLQSWVDEFQKQTTDNIIIMSGNVGVWTGNHSGGKVIDLESADDLLTDYDATVRLKDEGGNVVWECAHHDGTHYMGLYGLPKDEESRIKLVQELGIVDWVKDMYDYDSEDEALEDALSRLSSASELSDALSVEDYGKLPQYCPPIKSNVTIKEGVLEPQFSGNKSFYGKASVDTDSDGAKVLTSYSTKIAKVKDGKIEMLCDEDALSATTLRHLREFLKQEGIDPVPSKSEFVKMIKDKGINEADEVEEYDDHTDTEIVEDIIDKFKDITGVELTTIFNYEDTGNDAEGIFKQDKVEETSEAIVNYLKGKGLERSRIDDLLYKLDDELSGVWYQNLHESFLMNESIEHRGDCNNELFDKFNDAAKELFSVYFTYQDNDFSDFVVTFDGGYGNGYGLSFIRLDDGRYKMWVEGRMSKYIKPTKNKIFNSLDDIAEYINNNVKRENINESLSNDVNLKGKDVLYVFEDFNTGVDKNQTKLIEFANNKLKLGLDPVKDDLKIAKTIQEMSGDEVLGLIKECYGEEISNKFESFLDESLETLDTSKIKYINEQDQTVRVVTNVQEDRDYTITDITELEQVADGDVQPPIDITGLLNEVDARLNESVGNDWGVINYQSTRFNSDTKDSNALFELCVGDKTYLMSMLLEENGSLLKVNNTKGQTIFKRKSKDMVGLAESYIKQFIPKAEKEKSFIIKHINNDLHSRLTFIQSHIKELKSAPEADKEAFRSFIQNEIYGFVAELSGTIENEEPNDDDTSKLPTFDGMVEEVFGKEWVKVPDKENKLELDGVEVIKEAAKSLKETNYLKKYPYEKLQKMSDKELYRAWLEVKDAPDEVGSSEEVEYTLASDALWDIEGELCSRGFMDENNNKTEKWSELTEAEIIPVDDGTEEPENINVKDTHMEEPTDDSNVEVSTPSEGLNTGYATFIRKPKDIADVDNKTDSFTSGEASYIVVSKQKLSADEFDKLINGLSSPNEFCKQWEPIDTDNYAYNVIEFSCDDYDYKLLVDPSGFDYCRYVAKI